ncbi:ABC transporter ATP-binding protein [Treponema phagedenis]|uniref:ABC transporter ATP-binding protein n=2 Tax=Treponema phagedenis TaxID=162 RepID=A0AAE6M8K5_TREPH|nr:ABC transporter ATP-binding protein [Treponema phagedenis]QEJ99045.1 ABC transporter ATP-binding protein [Treponema phagedenis]QEK01818.1 ABC transporter ATP-binding protein [Treponema phagedenis]QEK04556.1 ABC transporter ATP-binding protein [Treponema phagedenis]QEK06932.1 ABC transporter ATP-binding protein [Treponema phagedenis]
MRDDFYKVLGLVGRKIKTGRRRIKMKELLKIENLSISLNEKKIIDSVSLSVQKEEVYFLVGETGCGKTILAKSILGLTPKTMKVNGAIKYLSAEGEYINLRENFSCLKDLRGKEILWVPQNTNSALNPLLNMEKQFLLPMKKRLGLKKQNARKKILELFKMLSLNPAEEILRCYPYELSGGMKVRAMIAIGLALNAKLLLLDEPTKGLDASSCLELMNLLFKLVKEYKMSILFITHDLRIVEQYSENIAVMHQGKIVDRGKYQHVVRENPKAYVRAFWKALPENGMEVLCDA